LRDSNARRGENSKGGQSHERTTNGHGAERVEEMGDGCRYR
jgi:hypothetical protein